MVVYPPALENNMATSSNRSASYSDQMLENTLFADNSPNLAGEAELVSCSARSRTNLDFLVLDDADVDLSIDNRLIRRETDDSWHFIMYMNAKDILHSCTRSQTYKRRSLRTQDSA